MKSLERCPCSFLVTFTINGCMIKRLAPIENILHDVATDDFKCFT